VLRMPWREQIGALVRQARTEAGLKQEALAEAVGVASLSISHYENGRQAPRVEVLERIASATGKHLAWFFGGEDAAPPTPPAPVPPLGSSPLAPPSPPAPLRRTIPAWPGRHERRGRPRPAKPRKPRVVALNSVASDIIREALAEHDLPWVFTGVRRRGPVNTSSWAARVWRPALAQAGHQDGVSQDAVQESTHGSGGFRLRQGRPGHPG